jgi:hypothetical protein
MFRTSAALALASVLTSVLAIASQPSSTVEVPASANTRLGPDASHIVDGYIAAELDWRSYHLNHSSAQRVDWQRGRPNWPRTPCDSD